MYSIRRSGNILRGDRRVSHDEAVTELCLLADVIFAPRIPNRIRSPGKKGRPRENGTQYSRALDQCETAPSIRSALRDNLLQRKTPGSFLPGVLLDGA
jgi:hypothetical protein